MLHKWRAHTPSFLIISTVLVGIVLRFYNLDHKIYWHDEVLTSVRVAGHYRWEYFRDIFDGHLVSVAELQAYQVPRSDRGVADLLQILARENAHHPPLYYLLMQGWVAVWGHSIAITRSLSALISLLAFPALYWLCLELFTVPTVGLCAVGLMAFSPLHLLYAQEARQYSLWVVWILVASAGLLRASRVKTKSAWSFYAVTLALSCYTFLFNGFVAIAHCLYIVLGRRSALKSYGWSALLSVGLFLPWILVIVSTYRKVQQVTNWTTAPMEAGSRAQTWGWNLSHLFFDVGLWPENPVMVIVTVAIALLSIYALIHLYRQTPRKVWLFIILLTGIIPLTLVPLDLLLGGQRSISARYFMPSYLGLEIAVAFLLVQKLTTQRWIWKGITLVIFTAGLASCLTISQVESWWTKVVDPDNAYIARIINRAERPLVITTDSDTNPASIISLSYLVDHRVKFQLVVDPNVPQIPPGFSRIFLFHPSEMLRQGLVETYQGQVQPVPKSSLWELTDAVLPNAE